jgi:hypothetical protein
MQPPAEPNAAPDLIREAEERGRLAERRRWLAAAQRLSDEADEALATTAATDHGKLAAWHGRKHFIWALVYEVLPDPATDALQRDASGHCNGQVVATRNSVSHM